MQPVVIFNQDVYCNLGDKALRAGADMYNRVLDELTADNCGPAETPLRTTSSHALIFRQPDPL